MNRRRLLCHAIASTALASLASRAHAQTWPDKDLRMVLPFSAGGSGDILARIYAASLARQLGRNVVVDNRPGAGGLMGSDLVAKSAPDGSTLLAAGNGYVTLPLLRQRMPYAEGDLVPVAAMTTTPSVLLTQASGAKTLKDLQALGRSRNNLNFGAAGTGSTGHFVAEMLRDSLHVPVTVVQYKSAAEVTTALMGGQIDVASEAAVVAQTYVRGGKLNALGVAADTRSTLLPGVPTTVEQGFDGIQMQHWGGLFVPRGTPNAVIDRLHAAIQSAMRDDPVVRSQLATNGYDPLPGSRADFEARLKAERLKLAKIVADSKMSQD